MSVIPAATARTPSGQIGIGRSVGSEERAAAPGALDPSAWDWVGWISSAVWLIATSLRQARADIVEVYPAQAGANPPDEQASGHREAADGFPVHFDAESG